MARLPKWMEAKERFEDGKYIITITKIKWWGWPFVLKLLIQQVIREKKLR